MKKLLLFLAVIGGAYFLFRKKITELAAKYVPGMNPLKPAVDSALASGGHLSDDHEATLHLASQIPVHNEAPLGTPALKHMQAAKKVNRLKVHLKTSKKAKPGGFFSGVKKLYNAKKHAFD